MRIDEHLNGKDNLLLLAGKKKFLPDLICLIRFEDNFMPFYMKLKIKECP